MLRIRRAAAMVCWLTAPALLLADPPKPEDQAKEAVEQFVKAVKAKDVDAAMKVADVLWLADGKRVIKDRDDLKTYAKSKLDGLKDPDRVPSEILRVEPWEKFAGRDRLTAEETKMADEVLGKGGLVVVLGRDGKDGGMILVRIEGGKAKVVGVAN